MYTIKTVRAKENLILSATFQNGIIKEYDVKQLFPIFPAFKELQRTKGLFEKVRVDISGQGIIWNDDIDLDARDIWEKGIEVGKTEISANDMVAVTLVRARRKCGITQVQLSEITGICQADISRIERGIANPSISTLSRLAKGLGLKLNIEIN